MFRSSARSIPRRPVGQLFLYHHFQPQVPEPPVTGHLHEGSQLQVTWNGEKVHTLYPSSKAPSGDTVLDHLLFTLKNEAYDLRLLMNILPHLKADIEGWVRSEPTSKYARRAWFLYEFTTGETLDLPNLTMGNYIDLFEQDRHMALESHLSPRESRYRIRNQILGNRDLVLYARRTPRMDELLVEGLLQEAKKMVRQHDPAQLARAIHYMYLAETRSTFQIEGETVGRNKAEQFVRALRLAGNYELWDSKKMHEVQRLFVDARYVDGGYRTTQVYVGEAVGYDAQKIHHIAPTPQDVPKLMEAWHHAAQQIHHSKMDGMVAAALLGFSFVYIHPYRDGNGRTHRFIIQNQLAQKGYAGEGLFFPVSAAITRGRLHEYHQTLSHHSEPLLQYTHYLETPDLQVVVQESTHHLFRAMDLTEDILFLGNCIRDTIKKDLPQELHFLQRFDHVRTLISEVVDMPARDLSKITLYFLQGMGPSGNGRLSKNKRGQFPELTDHEIETMTEQIQAYLEEQEPPSNP